MTRVGLFLGHATLGLFMWAQDLPGTACNRYPQSRGPKLPDCSVAVLRNESCRQSCSWDCRATLDGKANSKIVLPVDVSTLTPHDA